MIDILSIDSDGLKLPKLSSTNYRPWSAQMKLVLANEDLLQYINQNVNDIIDAGIKVLPKSPSPALSSNDDDTTPALSSTATTQYAASITKITKESKFADAKAMASIAVIVNLDQLGYIATTSSAFKQ